MADPLDSSNAEGTEDQTVESLRTETPMNRLDMDSAEIRILRAITELNNRIMMQATPEQRAILRGSIENLRRNSFPCGIHPHLQ